MTKKESGPGYTHTITIETDGDFVGYDALSGFGGIDPEFLLGEGLMAVRSRPDNAYTEIIIDKFLRVNQLYLGRVDTKQVMRLGSFSTLPGIPTAVGNGNFFIINDIDTIIPIYIGETPPLGLRKLLKKILKGGSLC